ncbi:UDP-N-acetylmuramoyl-L-alanine--D-glutamate ligase [Tunturiibacter gelidoferens]|uniref:UDP-N-acetylmuramoyl-L-alanine--D-glutamate ligase n=1 Tax=Tunturiibacter gelidiferens TaxID=3069689 RepID=UPI001619E279|nr:UDP-N-acetylmuramoyl-L-alanine--D-glutamate ligase [Edaphobacter lichenicola]
MDLKNKRVLVVGLGKSGLSAAMFLRGLGARVTVSDTRSAVALAQEIPALLEAGIMVESGGHGLLTFRRQDLIVVSPGVPMDTPEVKQVVAFGLTVIGELELASRYLQGQVVAITGSNGKTTTTTLVGKILSDAGLPTQVGGNIGLPVIDLVAKSTPETVNVLEVSSFQLETIEEFHPRIAVILNITPDHLDRHGSFEKYVAAKERIFERQGAGDALVLNGDDRVTQMCAARAKSEVFWFSGTKAVRRGAFVRDGVIVWVEKEGGTTEPVMPVSEVHLKGAHNIENVLAAVCVARLAKVSAESIRASVASFRAVEHRLEMVRKLNGVEFYNDSKATNVDATMKAVASFSKGIHLILGGKDKDSDYGLMAELLKERVKAVYTIGSAAEKVEHQLHGVVKMVAAGTLEIAVAEAAKAAVAGDVVLLSPACSSFDQFENYEHRGRVFRQLVNELI